MTFRERYPAVQVGTPRVVPGQERTVVELPTDDWTYLVVLDGDEVIDDGFAQREAARTAADWLTRTGRAFQPITSTNVRGYTPFTESEIPFPGAFQVTVGLKEQYSPMLRLLVYRGQVLAVEEQGVRKPTGPLPAGLVAALINERTGRTGEFPGVHDHNIAFAWDHGGGLWEYGYWEGISRGYALVRDGRLISLHERVPAEQWVPPHAE
jgi:hypothetical protein